MKNLTTLLSNERVTADKDFTLDSLGNLLENASSARFVLNVTAAAAAATDTLDLYLQSGVTLPDGATVWDDFIHFTSVPGDATEPVRHVALWTRKSPESEMHAPQDRTIAAGVIQGPLGGRFRARADVAGAGADFTFDLYVTVYD